MFHSFSWGVGESVIHTWPWWVVFSLSSSLRLSGRSNAIAHILASTTWICKEKVTILYMVCSVNRRLAGLSYAMPCSCKSEMKTRDHWLGAEEPGGLERNTIKKSRGVQNSERQIMVHSGNSADESVPHLMLLVKPAFSDEVGATRGSGNSWCQ